MLTRRSFLASLACLPVAVKAFFQPSTTLGDLSALQGNRVSTALYENINTSQALEVITDAAGWPSNLPLGKTTLNYWWLDDADAFEAVQQLLATEG